jgi:hypothetical protein
MPLIAQYAPNTPKTTVKIAVLLTKKATKSAFTVPALAHSRRSNRVAANDLLYPHLTPASVSK